MLNEYNKLRTIVDRLRNRSSERSSETPHSAGRNEFLIGAELAGKQWFWKITAQGADNAPFPPHGSKVLMIRKKETRCTLNKKDKPARVAMQALGTRTVTIIARHAPARSRACYAVPFGEEWLDEQQTIRVLPGVQIIDLIARHHKITNLANIIIGFELNGTPDVRVLWAFDLDGAIHGPFSALSPGNREEQLEIVEEQARLHDPEHYIDDSQEVWQLLHKHKPTLYPVQGEWHGVSQVAIASVFTLVAGVALASEGAYYWTLQNRTRALEQELQRESNTRASASKLKALVMNHRTGYAKAMSAPYAELTQAARKVWRPGLLVEANLDGRRANLTVFRDPHDAESLNAQKNMRRSLGITPPEPLELKKRVLNARGLEMRLVFQGTL